MITKELLSDALEAAVQQHFMKMFDVLMAGVSSDSDGAMGRFSNGMNLLIATEKEVSEMVATMED